MNSQVARNRSDRLVHLDFLRGVAILLVLAHHCPLPMRVHPSIDPFFDCLQKNGRVGVDLFFVLSGFLIGGLLFRERAKSGTIRIGRFLTRRAFKIWPAYFICLLTTCSIMSVLGRDWAGQPITAGQVFSDMAPAFAHVQNYFESTKLFAWFWSLAVEEHFYLLLPWLLIWIGRRTRRNPANFPAVVIYSAAIVGGVCLLLRAATAILKQDTDHFARYFPTHLRMDSLLAGVALAAWTQYSPRSVDLLRPYRTGLALLVFVAAMLPFFLPDRKLESLYPFDCTVTILASLCCVLLSHFADHPPAVPHEETRPPRGRRFVRIIAFVGFYSYSIYLWHAYFGPAIAKRIVDRYPSMISDSSLFTLIHAGTYAAVGIALGVVGSLLIERPFLALRERMAPPTAKID